MSKAENLIDSRQLTRNSIINILGYCAPILVAIVAIPIIIREMGTDRFGILSLAWAIIGYFSLFDFGLNRALTKLVAEKLGSGQHDQIPSLIWTSLIIMTVISLVVVFLSILILPWLVERVLVIPKGLIKETLSAFYLLSFAVPIVIISVGLRGVLSAYQRFDLVNLVRVPMGIYVFLAPIPVIKWYSISLFPVLAVLIFGRLIAVLFQLHMCKGVVLQLNSKIRLQPAMIRPLVSFGGWVTVTNIINPLLLYIDRFFIGAIMSSSAVAFYTTPNEVATKVWYLPWAFLGVLFPAFSTSINSNPQKAFAIYNSSLKYLFVAIFPIILTMITFSSEGLRLWIGIEFVKNSNFVLKIMALGVFFHSMAQVPYALIQGAGRPDFIAKLSVVIMPCYCILLWKLIRIAGIEGAAIAWSIRLIVDGLIVYIFAEKILVGVAKIQYKKLAVMTASVLIFGASSIINNLYFKIGVFSIILLLFVLFTWFVVFNDIDRDRTSKRIFHAISKCFRPS